MSLTTEFTVAGMTCGHCVAAVTEELLGVDGVDAAEVDLATGAVVLTSESRINESAISAAVAEAGYSVVP